MATASFNPKYRPIRTYTDSIMGRVDEYALRAFRCDGKGAQATFLRNNARPNRKREYGIKLFCSAREAFAAFQRQKIAADAGLAPPVRRMVKVKIKCDRTTEIMWGYQTCLAYGIGKIQVPYDLDGVTDPVWIKSEPCDTGVRRMYLALIRLSIAGTQIGDRPLGIKYKRSPRMCQDLHMENLGFWRKRPVVIDFGSHLVGESCC